MMAAGAFSTIEKAQNAICLPHKTYEPVPEAVATYERLYELYSLLCFGLGSQDAAAVKIGEILPQLRTIASKARRLPDHSAAGEAATN